MSKLVEKIALILAIVGAVNWGLVALLDFNLVTLIFGSVDILATIVYVLIALSVVTT